MENVIETQMLIRRQVSEVFEAFVNPEITSAFWFSRGSSRLAWGETVEWFWDMYKVSVKVLVRNLIPEKEIIFEWGDPPSKVQINFIQLRVSETLVKIKSERMGLSKTDVEWIRDNTEGFTIVLCGMKCFLEHGIRLNLIADKNPAV